MPYKPKACAYSGCTNITRERYCDEHKALASREYQRRRDPATLSRYGRQWKAVRDLYVSRHPLCERCLTLGRHTPVAAVHHVVPLANGGTDADENLMSVCASCHAVLDQSQRSFRD